MVLNDFNSDISIEFKINHSHCFNNWKLSLFNSDFWIHTRLRISTFVYNLLFKFLNCCYLLWGKWSDYRYQARNFPPPFLRFLAYFSQLVSMYIIIIIIWVENKTVVVVSRVELIYEAKGPPFVFCFWHLTSLMSVAEDKPP